MGFLCESRGPTEAVLGVLLGGFPYFGKTLLLLRLRVVNCLVGTDLTEQASFFSLSFRQLSRLVDLIAVH